MNENVLSPVLSPFIFAVMRFLFVLTLIFLGCSQNKVSKKDKPNYDRLWKMRDNIIKSESENRIDTFLDSSIKSQRNSLRLYYDSSNNLKKIVEKSDYSSFIEAYTAFFNEDSLFSLEYDHLDSTGIPQISTIYFFEKDDTIIYPIVKPKGSWPDPLYNIARLRIVYNQNKKRNQ